MHPLKPGADAEPASLCTLHAYYDLTDEGKAEPVLADLAARTKSESGCVYHGWTKAGDTLFCREGYLDSDAVLAHLSNVASCKGLADCTRLRRLELHGPPSQLAKLQDIAQQMGAECFERQEGFQRVALASAVKAEPLRGLHLDRTVLRDFCSIHAYYKVTNEEGVGRLLASFETRTRAEAGCLWYAWDRTDDRLFCNEAYANAEAVLAHVQHLEGVGSFGGAAQLTDIEFHGPAAELEKAMGSGFKFKASGNLFARTCGERSAFLYLEVMGTAKKLGAALFALESDVTFKPVDLCPEGKSLTCAPCMLILGWRMSRVLLLHSPSWWTSHERKILACTTAGPVQGQPFSAAKVTQVQPAFSHTSRMFRLAVASQTLPSHSASRSTDRKKR